MSLKAYLQQVVRAEQMEDLWQLHCQKLSTYGFDRLIYAFSRSITEHSAGSASDFVLLTNHDQAYTDGFFGDGLYNHAPMVRWGMRSQGVSSWSIVGDLVHQGKLSQKELEVLEFNRSHGVISGYSHSIASQFQRTGGGFAMTARVGLQQSEVDMIWKEHGDDIELMNTIVHLKITTLPYSGGHKLTARQREVLEWVGDGKTIADIALIMRLTSATIEKHLRLAREKLQVETTAQAVLKAAFQNKMFVID